MHFARVDSVRGEGDKCSVAHSVQPTCNLLYMVILKGNHFKEDIL